MMTMKKKKLLRTPAQDDLFMNEHQEKQKQQRIQRTVNNRFFVLFIVFFALILIIVSRLYSIQIVQHSHYTQMALTQFDETRYELPTRGEIIDRNGKVLVSNEERLSFIYLEPKNETPDTKWDKAVRFADAFSVDITTMTIRDKQDALIFIEPDLTNTLITDAEMEDYQNNLLNDNDLYRLKLSRIDNDLIGANLSQKELQQFYTYSKMQGAIGLDIVLKEDVTPKEVNVLLEHQNDFLGIEVRLNWDRVKSEDYDLQPILGEITTNRQGLLRDNYLSMQAADYKLNDRVGRSGLELTYEPILSGIRTKYSLTYSSDGLAQLTQQSSGRKGDTIHMTIDTDYQSNIQQIVEDYLIENAYGHAQEYFNQTYVVVSNPNNGEVLATVGVHIDDEGEIHYSPDGTYLNAFLVGSSIKGAVVYLALNEEIFDPGEIVIDEPLKIKDTPIKGSVNVLGAINDLTALSMSSNVYMFKTAIALGNAVYEYDEPLDIDTSAFGKIRSNFSQFGLGVETGLDVPKEETGYKSQSLLPGLLLDYVIGQYDSYTAMQLNQYVSTIANGEYRYKLRLVDHSFDSETGLINYQNPTTILNAIDNDMAMSRVQQGFRLCVTEGICSTFRNSQIPIAAKTGSAEDYYWDDNQQKQVKTTTNTLVAYAPYDNPEIAVSCIMPNFFNDESNAGFIPNGCLRVVDDIFNYHFEVSEP